MSVPFALPSALSYGIADFAGGLAALAGRVEAAGGCVRVVSAPGLCRDLLALAGQGTRLRIYDDPAPVLAGRERPLRPEEVALLAGGSGTYSIESTARLGDGSRSMLRAGVRVGASGVPGSAYTILRWEEGATPR